jgi:hypothetical protein
LHGKSTAQSESFRHSGFALLILPTCLLIGALHFSSNRQGDRAQEKVPQSLEIRLTKPVQWKDGCLSISLDRINRSPLPRFLPVKGLYLYGSVSEVGDDADKKPQQGWRNVYGLSDLGDWGATAIAPGTTVHDELCLFSTIVVVNLDRQTRREIPLRGRLKIDAYYFLTEEDWQKNKSQKELMLRTPANQRRETDILYPRVVTIFTAIPCREGDCPSRCDDPPPVLHGENRVVPDVFDFEPDWKARGKTVGEELARKYPPCPEASAPR